MNDPPSPLPRAQWACRLEQDLASSTTTSPLCLFHPTPPIFSLLLSVIDLPCSDLLRLLPFTCPLPPFVQGEGARQPAGSWRWLVLLPPPLWAGHSPHFSMDERSWRAGSRWQQTSRSHKLTLSYTYPRRSKTVQGSQHSPGSGGRSLPITTTNTSSTLSRGSGDECSIITERQRNWMMPRERESVQMPQWFLLCDTYCYLFIYAIYIFFHRSQGRFHNLTLKHPYKILYKN